MVPPMMAQKPMGIRMRDTGTSMRLAIRWAAGRKSAAAPMFCIMLEIIPTVPDIKIMILFSLFPASLMMGPATWFITPVLSRPAPMMITAMMEHTALLLKPTKASFGDIKPARGSSTIMSIPTTSTRTHSNINRTITKTKTIMVNIISGVMLSALLKSWVLSQVYYQSLFAAGDRPDRFLLFLILFSEPETQKKNK
jgi:hypothetical protein